MNINTVDISDLSLFTTKSHRRELSGNDRVGCLLSPKPFCTPSSLNMFGRLAVLPRRAAGVRPAGVRLFSDARPMTRFDQYPFDKTKMDEVRTPHVLRRWHVLPTTTPKE
jgi:hypothetical protein